MKPIQVAILYIVASALYLSSPAPAYVASHVASAATYVKCSVIACEKPAKPVAAKTVKKK